MHSCRRAHDAQAGAPVPQLEDGKRIEDSLRQHSLDVLASTLASRWGMEVEVCLEVGPEATGAFVPDHPGCWVFGRDQESVLRKVKSAVSDWYVWSKGRKPDGASSIEVRPLEVLAVTYNPTEAGKPEPLFWSEIPPVSTADINRTLSLMKHSREDLLKMCLGFDREILRWQPKAEPRSIGNCLKHIAIVERWYITRLDIDLPKDFPGDVFELLRHTRRLAEQSLGKLSREQRTGIFQPKNDPSPLCNLWTARKVLRRFVDHERLHANYIRRLARLYQSKA